MKFLEIGMGMMVANGTKFQSEVHLAVLAANKANLRPCVRKELENHLWEFHELVYFYPIMMEIFQSYRNGCD